MSYGENESKDLGFFRVQDLPDPAFKPCWENIIIDKSIKGFLLNYFTSVPKLDLEERRDCAVYGFAIFVGPPGCGKSAICRGLANELAERFLAKQRRRTKLLEVKVSTLFSAFLGLSVKNIADAFANVRLLTRQNPAVLFLDEIESIGVERGSLGAGDPSDVSRCVIAFLNEIDRLRCHDNVLILGTSNLRGSIDRALLDRADLKIHIGRPGSEAAAKILKRSALRLRRFGLRISPSTYALFSRTFYSNGAAPFSGRDLCRLPFIAFCSAGCKNLSARDVIDAANYMAASNGKGQNHGTNEEEIDGRFREKS